GEFFAYKSPGKEEMDEAENACFLLGGSGITTFSYSLPEGYGERIIAAVKKVKNTPQKYPRGNGKERKQPL
ncbi:MAG: 16S rRNA (guanine(527)-N(7))-methyltransferase RsmG, partial [Candidatus Scatosoma sp.]